MCSSTPTRPHTGMTYTHMCTSTVILPEQLCPVPIDHLWYLCRDWVILTLWWQHPCTGKACSRPCTAQHPLPWQLCCRIGWSAKIDPVAAYLDDRPLLGTFVTDQSWLLFHLLESQVGWSGDDLYTWCGNNDSFHCRLLCQDLEVITDATERVIKDVTDTAQLICYLAHRDTLIVVWSDHRDRVANRRKGNFNYVWFGHISPISCLSVRCFFNLTWLVNNFLNFVHTACVAWISDYLGYCPVARSALYTRAM